MKLKAHYETETYLTDGGYYAIRQDDPLGGDPAIVLLTPTQMQALIDDFEENLKDTSWANVDEGAK